MLPGRFSQQEALVSSFDYLKTAIRQKGCTLQQVADASGMTKGYLSQLLNAKIKSPSAQKLEALHRFLGLEFPRRQKSVGVVFGKFYPLHTGHIYLIQRACSQVDELHIVMGYDEKRDRELFEDSAMSQQPTISDRLRWLLQTFKYQKNIRIHAFNEEGMEPYPHGWDVWSKGIKAFMDEKGIQPNWIYSSEEADAPQYLEHLGIETVLIDPKRTFMNISGALIRENPFRYWDYIPTEVKPFFVRTVAILGGNPAGNRRWSISSRISSIPPARGSTGGIMSSPILAAMRWRCSIPTMTRSHWGRRSILILL
jgi:HTH-type transcriptional repressor of NAD biosynthesis genes